MQAQTVHWQAYELALSSHLLEYIPGRDQLWAPEALAAGATLTCFEQPVAHYCCVENGMHAAGC